MTETEPKPLSSAVLAISARCSKRRSGGTSGKLKAVMWRSSVIGTRIGGTLLLGDRLFPGLGNGGYDVLCGQEPRRRDRRRRPRGGLAPRRSGAGGHTASPAAQERAVRGPRQRLR